MSANVVDGLSVVYALARLRPIDITLPIWPAARRCIQMKKPMISTSGSSRLAQLSSQLELGVLASNSTPWLLQFGGLVDVGEAVRRGAGELLAVVQLAGDAVGRVVDGDALDLAVFDLRPERR